MAALIKTWCLVILCLWAPQFCIGDFIQSERFNVPASEFLGSVRSTIEAVEQVMSIVSKFSGVFGDLRLSAAISDCLDLLDLSMDELSMTLSASQNSNVQENGTGNLSADMNTWLSATLINQDTCQDGFEHTNSFVKSSVSGTLDQITLFVRDMLTMVRPSPSIAPSKGAHSSVGGKGSGSGGRLGGRKLINDDQFPYWLKSHDRKILQAPNNVTPNAVVAKDGTGNFTSIMDAVSSAPDQSAQRYVIYIKKGVYIENVNITKKKWNIMMIGDGIDVTVISGNRSYVDGWTTYRTATFAVKGERFMARDITFQNTAGPEKHQAVAFLSDSDLSVLYRCAMRGYQDTLYAHSMRQFYRECQITGTVDFMFGDASAVFQNCQILSRKGLSNQKNTVTAHGRKESTENTGFVLHFCNISAEPDVLASLNSTLTYLGRPWKQYSRTVIMKSYISNAIRPEGWLEWNETFALDTLYYGEYSNSGPGAGLGSRVKWPGYHTINDSTNASTFTVSQFIMGNAWLPSTGVKYTAGLEI